MTIDMREWEARAISRAVDTQLRMLNAYVRKSERDKLDIELFKVVKQKIDDALLGL